MVDRYGFIYIIMCVCIGTKTICTHNKDFWLIKTQEDLAYICQTTQETLVKKLYEPNARILSCSAHTVLLTDEHNHSAALDFCFLLLSIPQMLHIGTITGTDSVYSEVRLISLKSNTGTLYIPMVEKNNSILRFNDPFIPVYKISQRGKLSKKM